MKVLVAGNSAGSWLAESSCVILSPMLPAVSSKAAIAVLVAATVLTLVQPSAADDSAASIAVGGLIPQREPRIDGGVGNRTYGVANFAGCFCPVRLG